MVIQLVKLSTGIKNWLPMKLVDGDFFIQENSDLISNQAEHVISNNVRSVKYKVHKIEGDVRKALKIE